MEIIEAHLLKSIKFFDRVREQLRYWPYTLHQIDETLDVSLIEGRGKQLLYRAIHSQNLTAFVGSGLSMSYGRLSWRNWEKEQKRVVERKTKLFCELARAARAWNAELQLLVRPQAGENADQVPENTPDVYLSAREVIHHKDGVGEIPQQFRHSAWQWLRTKDKSIEHALDQVERLSETFSFTQEDGGHFPGGEELPVKFEIAQQLHNQLKEFTTLFLPDLPTDMPTERLLDFAWASAFAEKRGAAPSESLGRVRAFYDDWEKIVGDLMPDILMTARSDYSDAFEEFAKGVVRPESHLSFENLAKGLLIDECPDALILLRQGLLLGLDPDHKEDREVLSDIDEEHKSRTEVDPNRVENWEALEKKLDVFDRSNQRRDIRGIRDDPKRYRILTPFLIDNFVEIVDAATAPLPNKAHWHDFWMTVTGRLYEYLARVKQAGDSRTYLTPSSRFLVAVALSQCEDPFSLLGEPTDGKTNYFAEPDVKAFTSRRSIMADRFDPLSKIERDLGIRNFITTNYDFEIERYFTDQGYRTFERATEDDPISVLLDPASDESKFRIDNIGRVLKDQTFSPAQGAELTNFGLDERATGASVFHLHGRATKDGNLVITENDYMKLYLTQDEHRDTVDEGISIAFSGAPVLFLGLGMEETDLLRPLRQFISNRDRTVGYTSIALLPADRGMSARAKFSAALYLRYGVHTVFYGSGTIKITYPDKTDEEGKVEARGIDWLHRMIALKGAMDEVAKDYLDGKPGLAEKEKGEQQKHITEKLYSKVGAIGPDLGKDGYPAKTEALNVLLGWPEEDQQDLAQRLTKDREAKLRCCTFTPVRPPKEPAIRPHQNEQDAVVDGEKFLGFYTALMTELLRITVALPEMQGDEQLSSARTLRIALDGLHSAFITASLSAALEGIAVGKHKWWNDWQESPRDRIAQAQRLEPPLVAKADQFKPIIAGPDDGIKAGTVFVRHRVDNVITILDDDDCGVVTPGTLLDQEQLKDQKPARLADKFRTRIRAYDTFVAALACEMRHRAVEDAEHRQMVTVAARRGMGKGTFMSAFSSSRGLKTYKCAAWPHDDVLFAGSIFLNLGFSPEIGSAYDMLRNALIDMIALIEDMDRRRPGYLDTTEWTALKPYQKKGLLKSQEIQSEERKRLKEKIRDVSRLTALKTLFGELRRASRRHSDPASAKTSGKNQRKRYPRLLIVLSSVDLLFDEKQRPKNGEIDRFINLFFSDDLKDCPFDIVFLADDSNLGGPWQAEAQDSAKAADKDDVSEDGNAGTREPGSTSVVGDPYDQGPIRQRLDRAYLPELAEEQIQRAMRSSKILVNEPYADWSKKAEHVEDGMKHPPLSKGKTVAAENCHFVHFTRPMNAISLLVDNFSVLAAALYLLNPPRKDDKCNRNRTNQRVKGDPDPGLWDKLSDALRAGREASDADMDAKWQAPKLPTKGDLAEARGKVAAEVEKAVGADIVEHAEGLIAAVKKSPDYKTALRERLRPSAYRDGVDEWRGVRRSLGNSRFSVTMLLAAAETILIHSQDGRDGAEKAQKFIRDVVSQVHAIGQERRDQMVLDDVLSMYRRLHVIGHPDLDCELHFLILRHLGVIGSPVGSAVLVRLAEFRDYFDRIGIELEVSRRRFVVRALTVLAYRGLVFRLEPHPRLVYLESEGEGGVWKAEHEYRYALHRVVQNFALRNLEAGTVDPSRTNSFAPSLYAVMPSSGPRLSPASHSFLRSLMIGLSQYPDISNQDKTAEPWLFTTQDATIRVQALRAAMTLARSTFSVAVVSRTAAHPSVDAGLQKRGFLETYRVRLRWIIRMAWEISDEAEQQRKAKENKGDEPTPPDTIRALYRDEIVWLYNELGVISIAQGSLSDALGYLRQAAEENEAIEGRSRSAPIFNHIDLNHAIVQLERGNFRSARTRLSRVFEATSTRKWNVHWAAEGYLCVLDHLVGRREGVGERFEAVTSHFQEHNEARAAAIFLMHHGRFIGEEDLPRSKRLLKRARDLAETAGHEDIRHHIELTQIRVHIRNNAAGALQGTEIMKLQDVENFGRRTAIWSLQADALWLRANLLLQQRETSTAGRLLIRAMAICKRNAMTLRLNNAMTSYAEILLLRGDTAGASRMAQQSLDNAKRTGYSLETARAQAVLARCQAAPGSAFKDPSSL